MKGIEKILEEVNRLIEKHKNNAYELVAKEPLTQCYTETDIEQTKVHELAVVRDIIRKHMNDGWILVQERLPDKEADKFIKEKLDGIGYLYPCLLTYRSPNTERIHVVRFYYDVYERWFVNAGEELCDKDRCIAWRPLPEPYRPERSEK